MSGSLLRVATYLGVGVVGLGFTDCRFDWTGEEETTTIKHLFQQLSLALVKGNAALLNNRNPDGAGEGDEGIGWR